MYLRWIILFKKPLVDTLGFNIVLVSSYKKLTENLRYFVLIFLSSPHLLFAQQKPQYTQYILNQYALNPALTGIEDYTDIRLSNRIQWSGFKGAPVTSYFTINTPIGKKNNDASPSEVYSEPVNHFLQKPWRDDEYSKPYHGLGLQLIQDDIGPFSHFNSNLTYAYHMSLNSSTRLSGGIGLGISRYGININTLNFGDNLIVDPVIDVQSKLNKKYNADLNIGLWLYKNRFFTGLAVHQILPSLQELDSSRIQNLGLEQAQHYFFTSGYSLNLDAGVRFVPSIMIKYIPSVPLQADLNLKFQFNNSLFLGCSYRTFYGFAINTGVIIKNKMLISYSYDYSSTIINQVSNGSHEILFGFRLQKDQSMIPCPVGVW